MARPRDYGRSALQGLTLGWSDELGSAAGALAAKGMMMGGLVPDTGENLGQIYQGMQRGIDEEQNQFRRENPKAAIATELAGGLIPMFMTGGTSHVANIARAPGALKNIGHVGGMAGAYGAGSAEEGKRLESGLHHAVIGAGLGAVAPVALMFNNGSQMLQKFAQMGDMDKYARLLKLMAQRAGVTTERAQLMAEKYLGSSGNQDVAANTFAGEGV